MFPVYDYCLDTDYVKETYLLPCVPCNSALCSRPSECRNEGKLLPADYTHYMFPDWKIVEDYWEIFESRCLKGIVFTQTLWKHLYSSTSRTALYLSLSDVIREANHDCILFANEYQQYCYIPHKESEEKSGDISWRYRRSLDINEYDTRWSTRNIFAAAVWYYHHCQKKMPIVMVTHEHAVFEYENKAEGVLVMNFKEYLDKFWPDLKMVHKLFESLHLTAFKEWIQRHEYPCYEFFPHLPEEVLKARVKSGRYIQGYLHVNRCKSYEAFVRHQGLDNKDLDFDSDIIILWSTARNRAFHGDKVAVELFPKDKWIIRSGRRWIVKEREPMPTGFVVGILEKKRRDFVATVTSCIRHASRDSDDETKLIALPTWDYRIPKVLVMAKEVKLYKSHRVLVHIDSWPSKSVYAEGHVVRDLGQARDLDATIRVIMAENNIFELPSSEAEMSELPVSSPEDPWRVSPTEEKERRDLRSQLVFTIDSEGCEDLEDALSLRILDNGHLELGIHTADVSYFVVPDSCLDNEARRRANTLFLPHKRYDMIPAVLSTDLCSLREGADRYAVSVIWELEGTSYDFKNVWYGRTIIRSAYTLTYRVAQDLLDENLSAAEAIFVDKDLDKKSKETKLKELTWALQKLRVLANHFRDQRSSQGALNLKYLDVALKLDENNKVVNISPALRLDAHDMVYELMILANHWVAKRIYEEFPHQSLLRRHPPPRQKLFQDLLSCTKALGCDIDTRSNKTLKDSLEKVRGPNRPYFKTLLHHLAGQAMGSALYFSTGSCSEQEFYHYGLALDKYTHFTSPIRRYADIVVHRLLMAALAKEKKTETEDNLLSNEDLQQLCEYLNEKRQSAKRCKKQTTEHIICSRECLSGKMKAIVYAIRPGSVLVFLPKVGITAPVYLPVRDMAECDPEDVLIWNNDKNRFPRKITYVTVHDKLANLYLFDELQVVTYVKENDCHGPTRVLNIEGVTRHTLLQKKLKRPTSVKPIGFYWLKNSKWLS
ncbi:DIS3-like exonuclease 1 [Ochotona princeps]|uniref:DIS3-like exonuclease 1 n=1 Tax=Ochotona princeps TaxID=9978 RepID=UPI00271524EB|nr:DIS3-like exonuclease 1 [Ochotona princeps]